MSEPFIGEIILFAGNFAPSGWALCNGQTISIQQNQALFSIIGTTYGGNGVTTFNLPDLRGRVAVSAGQGIGLSSYALGEQAGTENVTLLTSQIPQHNHAVKAQTTAVSVVPPTGAYLGQQPAEGKNTPPGFVPSNTPPGTAVTMAPDMISLVGGSQPHTNIQPTLALNYIIALQGIYPTRN
jgi:microcystin-dependent protein